MTDNENPQESRRTTGEFEWAAAFDQLEQFGVNIAQWLTQMGIGEDADLQTVQLKEKIEGVKRANIRLDLTVGKATINALPASSDNLFEADVVTIGAAEMSARTEGDGKSVRMRQKRSYDEIDLLKPVKDAVDTVARIDQLKWDVKLSPNIPITLEIAAGLTIDEFDFTGLQLTRLKMDGGTGRTVVTLPGSVTNATIEGGVGILDLYIPNNAKTTLAMDLGAGATNIFIGEATVKADIDGGVGNCTITVPKNSAVRVRADSGLGNIVVPETMHPVEFESEFISESGTWQTAEFEFATHKVDIRYEGGVGSLLLEHADEGENKQG